jgi:hypothetical protein
MVKKEHKVQIIARILMKILKYSRVLKWIFAQLLKDIYLFVCLLSRVPEGRTTVLLLKSIPLPHCIMYRMCMFIIPAGDDRTLLQVWARIH